MSTGLCMYTVRRFCMKGFNLLFSCFVSMYILTMSNIIHSFKFLIGCEVNAGTGLQQQNFSL